MITRHGLDSKHMPKMTTPVQHAYCSTGTLTEYIEENLYKNAQNEPQELT